MSATVNPLPLGGGEVKAPKRKLNLRDRGSVYWEGAPMSPDDSALFKAISRPSGDRVLVYAGGLVLAVALLWTLLG